MWRIGLRELVHVRIAWTVAGEEREARLVEGRVVDVRFEGDFKRVQDDVDVRREEEAESWPGAKPESWRSILMASNFGEGRGC